MPEGFNVGRTWVDVLRTRAVLQPDALAFGFLNSLDGVERWTYAQLDRRARALAAAMAPHQVAGKRVLVLFPSSLEYVAAFFACLYAGAVAVPVYPPRSNRVWHRVATIVEDADVSLVLATRAGRRSVESLRADEAAVTARLAQLPWIIASDVRDAEAQGWSEPTVSEQDLAFLQYTSGSTAEPKGVMLTHANLLENQRMIAASFGTTEEFVGVSWLPLYHDMGLIGGVLHPVFCGRPCYLMPPEAFLMRPIRWITAISRFGATMSGGPNFGYDLCIERVRPEELEGLDLSRWRVAFNGAERVSAQTLDKFARTFARVGFKAHSFVPCYGLAEATLLVCGGPTQEPTPVFELSAHELARGRAGPPRSRADRRRLVASGRIAAGQEVMIVDPVARKPLPDDRIGEVWVRGPNVACGYWRRQEQSEQVFRAHLAGDDGEDRPATYLRTGDLGFMRGERLTITGRLKDLIIIGGRNYYPDELERVVQASHPAIRHQGVVAFSVDIDDHEELIVCAEIVDRVVKQHNIEPRFVEISIRRAIFAEESLTVRDVVLLRPGAIPKTSSGKVQRNKTKGLYVGGSLARY